MKKTVKNIVVALLVCVITVLVGCGNKGYQTVNTGTTRSDIEKTGDFEEKTDEYGNTYLSKKDCSYLSYKGTATYAFSEDALLFSKWEYTTKEKEDAKKVFDDIVSKQQEAHGDIEPIENSEEFYTWNWNQDADSISVTCVLEKETWSISLTEVINGTENK